MLELVRPEQIFGLMLNHRVDTIFVAMNKKMDEKTLYLDTLTYEDNADTIEGLLKTNVKLFDDYERLLKLVDKENNEGSTKGGAEESASEKGLI